MIAPLAKFVDWSALQMAYVVAPLRHAPKPKWKLEEALEFLNGPDFISAASDPARIKFDGPRHFKFPTPRTGQVEENNIVYGRNEQIICVCRLTDISRTKFAIDFLYGIRKRTI